MFEHLSATLPESARACRALYDPASGGYRLPPRSANVPIALGDVPELRLRYPELQFDCIEAPAADLLYSLVVNTRSGRVLETGTSRGFSTSHLAAAARFVAGEQARVLTLDIAPTPHPFFANSDLATAITTVQADSLSVDLSGLLGEARFDFMFFDALHTYAHLSGELARHLPLLKVGGLFALHDTFVYDDLGLVVLWTMASGCFEAVSLPTHRSHGAGRRSPGVSVFRKLVDLDAGDLLHPNLEGVVEGERECLLKPRDVVARTGSLFRDRRYAARDLHRAARAPASPALLDPAAVQAPPVDAAEPDLSPEAVARHLAVPPTAADRPAVDTPLHLNRLDDATQALRASEAEWWRLYGAFESQAPSFDRNALRTLSTQRWIEALGRTLAGHDEILHIGYGSAGPAALLGARHWDLRSHGVSKRLPHAGAYVFHRALYRLVAADIEAVMDNLRRQAPSGAAIVLIEPVCFPGHSPDAKDRAIVDAMDGLVREAARAVDERTPSTARPRVDLARREAAARWWGERPRGPSPLEQPFAHQEPELLLRRRFRFQGCEVVESIREGAALLAELRLLPPGDAGPPASIAHDLLARLDVLERVLLGFAALPDTSWYLTRCLATA